MVVRNNEVKADSVLCVDKVVNAEIRVCGHIFKQRVMEQGNLSEPSRVCRGAPP